MPGLLRAMPRQKLVIAGASMPDAHGYFTLGTNADYCAALIGEVPFFLGRTIRCRAPTEKTRSMGAKWPAGPRWTGRCSRRESTAVEDLDPRDRAIAEHIVDRIPDGACMQFGIGSIPDAVASLLRGQRRDLGVHTEVITDGLMKLIRSGTATGVRKTNRRGQAVATFALGSRELWPTGSTTIPALRCCRWTRPMIHGWSAPNRA